MKQLNVRSKLLLAVVLLLGYTLFPADLTYDMASGKITGFDLTKADNPSSSTSSTYTGSTEAWEREGFVGRLNYRGEPTTLTFSNTGDVAIGTGASNTRFSFTYFTDGVTRLNRWREFFIVARVKGLYHNGNQHDYVGKNVVVVNNPSNITIGQGAGPETVTSGQGYSIAGAGPSNANSTYKYKYKYQYIWVDVTLIRTGQTSSTFDKGYYVTQITASTTTGASYTMDLVGQNKPSGSQEEPSPFYFGVESLVSNPFPYDNLFSKNSINNTLLVGKLKYFSILDSAYVRFASNPEGTAVAFKLTSPGVNPVSYYVVFDPTTPNTSASKIISSSNSFDSAYVSIVSPIDGTSTPANVLEGNLLLYVDPDIHPMAGQYSSIIYCILTQT